MLLVVQLMLQQLLLQILASGLTQPMEPRRLLTLQTEATFEFQPLNETPEGQIEITPTPIILYPTSTPLPSNPASLTTSSIVAIFWQSALLVLVLFSFFSLVLRLRKNT